MLAVLRQCEQQKKRSGRPSKLLLADQLMLTLMYWREHRTQFQIAKSYGIHEANVNRIIRKVEGSLVASGTFSLPGKRAARSDEGVEISFIIVDVTETPIERLKKATPLLQGRKRQHTLNAQKYCYWQTQQIIATSFGKGRAHDFKLFKHSCTHIHPDTMVLADLGYLGLKRIHAHTLLPVKATKHHPLTYKEKRANRTFARPRLHIKQVIGKLKVFRILAERYRGRRKRFGLRFNLISDIHNA